MQIFIDGNPVEAQMGESLLTIVRRLRPGAMHYPV